MTHHRFLVLGLGFSGAVGTQFLTYRWLPLAEIFSWNNWDSFSFAGASAGALIGHLVWVCASPRQRLSRAAAACVVVNAAVWLSFLALTPPLSVPELQRINAERAERDADHGFDLTHDLPVLVAGRWHETFFVTRRADRLLSLAGGPAIAFADILVKPPRYIGLAATRNESMATAGFGFVLSTAFWTTCAGLVSALLPSFRGGRGGAEIG